MFSKSAGFKTQYHFLTLIVAPDFDEWRIFLQGRGVTIHGGRQFTETKAKESACTIAASYILNEVHEELPPPPQLDWTPVETGAWLNYRP